jgi:hypothetical protein
LFGRTVQGVRATATAQILSGNAVDCMKPWAIVDKWEEHWEGGAPSTLPWSPDSHYDRWKDPPGPVQWTDDPALTGIDTPDIYIAPTEDDPGTGFQPFDADGNPTADYGTVVTMTESTGAGYDELSPGFFLKLDLLGGNYNQNILGCTSETYGIGQRVPIQTGGAVGQTNHGVYQSTGPGSDPLALYERDPTARWNTTTKQIENSCAPGPCPYLRSGATKYVPFSPRIVPVAVFDIDRYLRDDPSGSNADALVTITNIFGFFVLSQAEASAIRGTAITSGDVWGVLVSIPGVTKGSSTVPITASFLKQVILVR